MKKKNGFTLIELIAAITILGVLLLIGSQVVIETMNKNKTKAVYQSMDNISKQARLTFLEDPETWEEDGQQAIRDSVNYNEKDMVIGRANDTDNKIKYPENYFGGSRVICVGIDGAESKFKNLKFEYFLQDKNLYMSYDVGGNEVYYFNEMDQAIMNPSANVYFKTHIYKKDDYIFYLRDNNGCAPWDKYNDKLPSCYAKEYEDGLDPKRTKYFATKEALINYENFSSSDGWNYKYESGELKITGDSRKNISKYKVSSICKVFISEQEFDKYRVK